MSTDLNSYTIKWCRKAKQFIGTCSEHPKLHFYSDDREKAMQGIQKLVANVNNDGEIKELLVDKPLISKQKLLETNRT